jgi:predicted RecA/RadA family phage recombinase
MANDLVPYKRPGDDVTGIATSAITGKRCVQITGAKTALTEGLSTVADGNLYKVGHPNDAGAAANGGASKYVFGVAKYDAAIGKQVGIVREGIVPIRCSAALTFGQKVMVAADGTVIPYVEGAGAFAIGMACNSHGINTDAEIALF